MNINRFIRRCRSVFYHSLDEIFVMFGTFLITILILTYWNANYSDVCTKKLSTNFRSNYITHVNNIEIASNILNTAIGDISSDLVISRLYTENYDYSIEYAYAADPESNFRLNYSLIPARSNQFFREVYDDGNADRCSQFEADDIDNPYIKRRLSDVAITKAYVSCPFLDNENYLLGNLAVYFVSETEERDIAIKDIDLDEVAQKLKLYALKFQESVLR